MWKHYKLKKNSQITSTPAHILLGFNDNSKVLNFTNLNQVGLNTAKDASAFKKSQYFSKTNPQGLFNSTSEFQSRYAKLCDLYLNNASFNDSSVYGTLRQHNLSSTSSTINGRTSLLDPKSLSKLLSHNLESTTANTVSTLPDNRPGNLLNLLSLYGKDSSSLFNTYAVTPDLNKLLDSSTDDKHPKNTLKYLLSNKHFSGELVDSTYTKDYSSVGGLVINYPTSSLINSAANTSKSYTFKDNKSSNMQFLTSEKNIRPVNQLLLGKTTHNLLSEVNNLSSVLSSIQTKGLITNQFDMFNKSNLG